MDEDQLIQRARKGSKEAFSALVLLHHGPLRAYLASYVGNQEDADDLAQETLLRAYQGMGTYSGKARLRSWLFVIARNLVVDYIQDAIRRRGNESGGLKATLMRWRLGELERDGSDIEKRDLEFSALQTCMEQLPSLSARILEEFYFKGRSASDIGDAIRKTENAIFILLTRTRKALRQCMSDRLEKAGIE